MKKIIIVVLSTFFFTTASHHSYMEVMPEEVEEIIYESKLPPMYGAFVRAKDRFDNIMSDMGYKEIYILYEETYRSQERQNYLYSIGRTRQLHRKPVTYARVSHHTSWKAMDIIISEGISPYRDIDYPRQILNSRNGRDSQIWGILIYCMKAEGFIWGGDFRSFFDPQHFEYHWEE